MYLPTNNEDTREDGESVSIDPKLGEFNTYLAAMPDTLRTNIQAGGLYVS